MSRPDTSRLPAAQTAMPHRAVDPVMLFFDLVYVFLITELNGVLRAEEGWRGIVHCAVLLALVYWQWVLVTVQSSIRDASTSRHRFVIMLLMLIAMVSAVALPGPSGTGRSCSPSPAGRPAWSSPSCWPAAGTAAPSAWT